MNVGAIVANDGTGIAVETAALASHAFIDVEDSGVGMLVVM